MKTTKFITYLDILMIFNYSPPCFYVFIQGENFVNTWRNVLNTEVFVWGCYASAVKILWSPLLLQLKTWPYKNSTVTKTWATLLVFWSEFFCRYITVYAHFFESSFGIIKFQKHPQGGIIQKNLPKIKERYLKNTFFSIFLKNLEIYCRNVFLKGCFAEYHSMVDSESWSYIQNKPMNLIIRNVS